MQYYFAPMEGLTDSIYRRLHQKYFGGVDRYYTPFLSPTVHRSLTQKEARELPPADTLPVTTIPQVLTKVPEDLLWLAEICKDLGYSQINLNSGCPSGTVTAKGKGAGMLRDRDSLRQFLDTVFAANPLPISIKTRIGFENPEEFPGLLEIFNDYPICELILHPRVRKVFYNGPVDMDMFRYAAGHSKIPLCYNGNLCSRKDIESVTKAFPGVGAVMIGRGLIGDPGMLCENGLQIPVLEHFLEELFQEYTETFGSSRNAMFRMKENWRHLFCRFHDAPKLQKQLRKTVDPHQFRAITKDILHTLPLRDSLCPDW